jgi:hypothetical protein
LRRIIALSSPMFKVLKIAVLYARGAS